jgi:hypothetical protein
MLSLAAIHKLQLVNVPIHVVLGICLAIAFFAGIYIVRFRKRLFVASLVALLKILD